MAGEPRVVVVGAGIGGLTTAAVLARAGLDVSVLEAHIYPGGCAGTFYHQGYRFDAGATLAGGFYPGGPMNLIAGVLGIESWPAKIAQPAMTVHLPDGYKVNRRGDDLRWEEHRSAFGKSSDQFWNWQENTADLLWELALRLPSWPPQTLSQMLSLAKIGFPWLVNSMSGRDFHQLVRDSFSPVAAHLPASNERLKLFVDAQLLISAQTISLEANSLFGAAALDLPRRGVVHLKDGMGTIAQKIVDALLYHGGKIHYRNEVSRIVTEKKRVVAVETKRGDSHPADLVVANLTPWNIASLLNRNEIALRNLPHKPIHEGWGAFMVYVGADGTVTPANYPLHHQVIRRRPLGEGNTVFVSLSPEWDPDRAPSGKRAITISTHTDLKKWWYLFATDSRAYEEQKQAYTSRILEAAEVALPGIQAAASLILPGTPVTFQRFTRRHMGWVGGFPQTNIFKYMGPRLMRDLWMVGDSIFPGQSTAATALGGLRVAHNILSELGIADQIQPYINRWKTKTEAARGLTFSH